MQLTGGFTFTGIGMSLVAPPSGLQTVVLTTDINTSPYIKAVRWDSSTAAGFGTPYSNPSVLPENNIKDAIFDTAGSAVLYATTGNLGAYTWNSASGFGTKFSNYNVGGRHLAIAPAGDAVLFTVSSGGLSAVRWNPSTGYGTAYSDPSTPPPGNCDGLAFCGNDIITNHYNSPYVSAYPWDSSTGFGTKRSNPSTIVTNGYPTFDRGNSVTASTGAVIISTYTNPWIYAYAYSSGFGSKYSNPATLPGTVNAFNFGTGVTLSPSNNAVAIGNGNIQSPYINVYPWSDISGFGTRYSNPGSAPTAEVTDIAFSPAGDAIISSESTTTSAWAWTVGSGFGTKYSGSISGTGITSVACATL